MPRVGGIRSTRAGAELMLRTNTPVEDYRVDYGMWVKREDLACLPPGPQFSKTRGVYARVSSVSESIVGVLDTVHSQAGHAVAIACKILGKKCINFYPLYKGQDPGELREPQRRSKELGAEVYPLRAGRSCILFHAARKHVEALGGYMMPNALKLEESVAETAKECKNVDEEMGGRKIGTVIIPVSSGTIAAGVMRGLGTDPDYILHLGYSRSTNEVVRYVRTASGLGVGETPRIVVIDEGYSYKDQSRPGATPSWPCNEYYDLKAFRWWVSTGKYLTEKRKPGEVLFWNVG